MYTAGVYLNIFIWLKNANNNTAIFDIIKVHYFHFYVFIFKEESVFLCVCFLYFMRGIQKSLWPDHEGEEIQGSFNEWEYYKPI